jgi:hypothetical protein
LVPHPRKLAATARPKVPDRFTASELMKLVLPPVRWAVPGLVAEGLAILAGVPKAGKSWLALHIALGVAAGDGVLGGAPVEAGPVLYLALEDTQRRLQKRLTRLNADATRLTSLHFRLRGTPFDTKGLVALQAEVRDLRPRLVVIDTLAKVRPALSRREESNAYQSDYGFVAGIKRLADDYDAPIICVHHTSKAPRADPVAEVSGTLGLSGAADSIIVMKRDRHKKEATLFITGRDVDEQELAITADIKGGIWRKLGDATEHRLSRERQDILTLLTGRPGLRPKEIATALGRSNDSVRYLLGQMSDDGQVRADGLHRYFVAKPSQPSHPHSPEQDNTGQ